MSMTPLEIALERIEECCRTRAPALDLSELGLDKIPEQVFELTWLEKLDVSWGKGQHLIRGNIWVIPAAIEQLTALTELLISGNYISTINFLYHTPHLKMLDCSFNQISSLSPLIHAPNLQTLRCDFNQISSLSPLTNVPNLQTLRCDGNPVSSLVSLAYVPNLQHLCCWNTRISDLSPLAHVPHLQTLNCGYNQIVSLGALIHVPNLQQLLCGDNQINSLSPLAHIPNLQTLYCGHNQIRDLAPLARVPNLQRLYCGDNQIHDLGSLAYVPNLQTIQCLNNKISDLSPIYDYVMSGQLHQLWLYGNPVLGIPAGILGNNVNDDCLENLRNYWHDLAKGKEGQRQIKVQLVGNGRVGKTTLAYILEHKRAPSESFKSTHGIIIKEIQQALDSEEKPVTLQLWDFGGQEIYHATHRLFLSDDCLYLLLWAENTEEKDTDENLHPVSYWLEVIHDLAPNSQVILIKNQIDQFDEFLPIPEDLTKDITGYNQIQQSLKISAFRYKNINALRGAIQDVLTELKHRICLELPTSWLQIQRELKQLDQKTIPFAHFKQLCIKAGIDHAEWFVGYLHKTGVLFYQEGAFQDQIILNQDWVIKAVYRIFDPDDHRSFIEDDLKGHFKSRHAKIVWPDVDEADRKIYLDFMRNCGICYEPNHRYDTPFAERTFIIPALLPKDSPTRSAWHKNATDWQLDIEYPFLHRSIIERIILRLGETYQGEPWRTGIFCDTEYGQVLLECEYRDKQQSTQGQLSFHLRGNQLAPLVYALRKLVSEISPHRRYQEYLQQGQANREALPEFKETEEKFSSLLDPIEPTKTLKLFISYSRIDREHKLMLEKHLRLIKEALKHQVKLDIWSDHLMDAGEGVNDKILPELRSADLILLLVSPDFLDPERYSRRIELPIALERHEKEGIPVIPVLVRHTVSWHETLGHLTVATHENADSLEDWSSPGKFWGSVEIGIRKQVEKLGKC